jgi:tetratricopeptide (TPR) repeat protein
MLTIAEALDHAVRHHRTGELREAERLYRQVLQADPRQADALHLLGVLAGQLGRANEAVALLREALLSNPRLAEAHSSLGNALKRQGRLDEAVACYRQALALQPGLAEAHNNLGNALRALGRPAEAEACYRQALGCRPAYADAHNNLGVLHREAGRPDEAVACLRQAVALNPGLAEAHSNLGAALKQQGRLPEAADALRHALRIRPNYPEAHNNLGNALQEQGQLAEAVACFQQALCLNPEYADAHNNLGVALMEQGPMEEAVACFQQALRLLPDNAEMHTNLAMCWLLMGNFEQGWREYEWRLRCKDGSLPPLPQPGWDGSSLAGRTILLRAEQGLGDTLHFIRYAGLVKQQGATVLVECQKSLMPLLASCPGIDRLVPQSAGLAGSFDAQAPLLSLPALLGTTLATVPAQVPYLFPDTKLVEHWREQLGAIGGFKIGIAWQGNPRRDRRGVSQRSLRLDQLEPLGRLAGVRLLSLQKGPGAEQLETLANRFPVINLGRQLDEASGAFMDTAAVMNVLDLVITTDTATAHLAGALGVPVWVALPFAAEWRWLRDREDSVWYPTMRLFRQTQPGNWQGVVERMAAEVTKRFERKPRTLPVMVAVSPGELIDKITILEIKNERMTDSDKLDHVRAELAALRAARSQALAPSEPLEALTAELRAVNEALWQVEDEIRLCERNGDFGPRFIALARSVYQQNDRRAALKRQINTLLGSDLVEEKAYRAYE